MSNRLKLTRREMGIALVVLVAVLLGAWLPGRIIVSVSPSLHKRIFLLLPVPAEIKDGDYLVFRHQDPEMMKFLKRGLNEKNDRLIKRVGCAPGDLLFKDNDGFHCSILGIDGIDNNLGKPLTQDSEGRKLPQFTFQGFVPQDSYFMVGDHPRSFDSRYFGFVHAQDLLYKALPIWPIW